MFLLAGLGMALLAATGWLHPRVRHLETEIPDQLPDQAPGAAAGE
jgi:hypothetical protein